MRTRKQNIYILGNNPLKLGTLRNFLLNKLKNKATIFLYFRSKSFWQAMHRGVDLVILDHLNEKGMNPEHESELLKSLKERFPELKVILLTSNDDVSAAIETMGPGSSDHIVEDKKSLFKIRILIDRVLAQPTKRLYAEWGVMKFTGWLIFTFLILSTIVALALI